MSLKQLIILEKRQKQLQLEEKHNYMQTCDTHTRRGTTRSRSINCEIWQKKMHRFVQSHSETQSCSCTKMMLIDTILTVKQIVK